MHVRSEPWWQPPDDDLDDAAAFVQRRLGGTSLTTGPSAGEASPGATPGGVDEDGLDEMDRALRDLLDGNSDGDGDDSADAGTKAFEREQELSIANNRRDLLVQMERAMERLDKGTYGHCESCVQPIMKARLQAFPSATLCVKCKQREERR